jgi:hypothetical protein
MLVYFFVEKKRKKKKDSTMELEEYNNKIQTQNLK